MGDSALAFKIDQSVNNAWGITYLYGCTALMISDPDFVIGTHYSSTKNLPGNRLVCYTLTNTLHSCSHAARDWHEKDLYQRSTNAK